MTLCSSGVGRFEALVEEPAPLGMTRIEIFPPAITGKPQFPESCAMV
jgi:hypothetical protein